MKDELERRWGTIDLLEVLKEADHVTGFTDEFTSVASREITGREELTYLLGFRLFPGSRTIVLKEQPGGGPTLLR